MDHIIDEAFCVFMDLEVADQEAVIQQLATTLTEGRLARLRNILYPPGVGAPPPSDAAPVAPRTERMDLHDEMDRRFPLFEDFAAFVKRGEAPTPKRETRSCDRCGGGGYLTVESPRCPDCNEAP